MHRHTDRNLVHQLTGFGETMNTEMNLVRHGDVLEA